MGHVTRMHKNRRHAGLKNRLTNRLAAERLEERAMLALVSYWSADDTALDLVGPNHGTLVSGASYAAGQVAQAFSFDGVDDRVQVADSPSLKLTQSLTIEAWVKADSLTPWGGIIMFRGDDRGGLDPYSLSTTSIGNLQFQVSSLTGGMSLSTKMPVGQFAHVAGTLDDATGSMRLYVNGVLMAQTVTAVRPFGDLDPGSNPGIGIGNHGGYPTTPHNFPFDGLIDELKIYNHALTGEEILGIFNTGKGNLQPAVSISDTMAIEGDPTIRNLGSLVAAGEGGLNNPDALVYGSDGNLYVSSRAGSSVLRYDGLTGEPRPALGKSGAEFVTPGDGGLNSAREISFGPDGNLYVVSELNGAVLRYDAVTGEPLGALVSPGRGGLARPRGLLFHSDGFLYVTSVGSTIPGPGTDSILRFSATTGEPAGLSGLPEDAAFIASGTDGMDNPSQIVFQGGDFYVSSTSPSTSNSVLRFGTDGSSKGAFVPTGSGGLSGPVDLEFQGGFLYVTSWSNNKILRYNGTTGAFVDELLSADGLATPLGLVFAPSGDLLVASAGSNEVVRIGASPDAYFTVSLSAPFPTQVSVNVATTPGTAAANIDYATSGGTLTFAPGASSKTVRVPVVNDAITEFVETFSMNLTSVVGGTIADGQATGTIADYSPELRVNTTTANSQTTTVLPTNNNPLVTQQAVATDGAGNFVVAWSGNGSGDADGIFFQRYGSNGSALGGETRANATTTGAQTNPVVGRASTTGKYVIAWNSSKGVYGRVFNSNGTAATSEFTIAAGSNSTGNYVDSIAVDADGDFVVLYKQFVQKGISESRYWQVQRYNASGQAQGSAIRVTTLNLINGQAGVATDSNGNFVVVWDDGGINAQRFNNSGKKVGSQITVSNQSLGNVGRDADGDFVVTSVLRRLDGQTEHYVQVFNNDGSKRGGAILTRTSTMETSDSIAVQAGGDFVLSWTEQSAQTATDVFARRFNLNGVPKENAQRINLDRSGNQEFPSVAVAGNGDFVVAWNTPIYQSNGAAGDTLVDSDVRARRVAAPAALMAAGGTGSTAHSAITAGPGLQAIFAEAVRRWEDSGLSPAEQQVLGGVAIKVVDLSGATLGLASGHTIWLDHNAAGWGWFVDLTPGDDREFRRPGNQGEQHRMDLLTVVMHELGHILGYEHDEAGVMTETLVAGVRRTGLEHDHIASADQAFGQSNDHRVDAWLGLWLNEQFDSAHGRAKRRR